jgi:hypothetical protein
MRFFLLPVLYKHKIGGIGQEENGKRTERAGKTNRKK